MTGVQFAIQNLLARFVIKAGIVTRTAAAVELDWRQYMKQGEGHSCMRVLKATVCTGTCKSTSDSLP